MNENYGGLTSKEAKSGLLKYGPNLLPETPPPKSISLFVSQLKNPLVYILLIAAFVTLLLGHISDTLIIAFAVLLNTVLGFLQEKKASNALYALKKLIHKTAKVIRDGKMIEIKASDLVPGDIVILDSGSKIPADGIFLEANRLFVNEAILTGESLPVSKDRDEEAFMGTVVTAGRGVMRVEKTGEHTKMGQIAEQVQVPSSDTPLRRQLTSFSRQLTTLVLVLTAFVLLIGIVSGQEISEIFTTSVALAVSAIPEGLLVGLTVVLAIGMRRILDKKGLVRNLISVETLGGVTTICVDKTGTLTKGEMVVEEVVGDESQVAQHMLLANDLDDPMLIAAYEWAKGKDKNYNKLLLKNQRIDSIPFSSEEKYFAGLNEVEGERYIFVSGAPDVLIEWTTLSAKEKEQVKEQARNLAKSGKRLLGLARKKATKTTKLMGKEVKGGLEWEGLVVYSDPVRKSVAGALKKAQRAGIRIMIITGDYAETALSVASELDFKIDPDKVILGAELGKLDIKKLAYQMNEDRGTWLFARTTPDQKLTIVKALKELGEVVAMTGDGVNDAPALKEADIGVVVGEASEVAKETADLVLLDSSFETIIAAVEEGRGIFDNIRKIILYLMCDAFGEIFAVIAAIIIGVPLPITAAQILWINIVSDGFPHLALTVDPKSQNAMNEPPRSVSEKLINSWVKMLIFVVSVSAGAFALVLYLYFLRKTGDVTLSRSVAFATLGVNSLVYVFSVKTLTQPFWKADPLNNRWLNLAVFVGLVFQFLPFATVGTRQFFGLSTLLPGHLVMVFSAAFAMFIIIEATKSVIRTRLSWFQH